MNEARRPLLVLMICAALLAVSGTTKAADDETPDLPRDEWHALFMKGKRVGYLHVRVEREDDIIVTLSEMKMVMRRFGTDLTVETSSTCRERADGTPEGFVAKQIAGMMPMRTEGTIQDGTLHVVTTMGDRRQEQTLEWDPDALFPYALEQEQKALKLEPGEEFTAKVFSPELSSSEPLEITMKVIGPDTVDVLGVAHKAVKVEARYPKLPGFVQHLWVDSDYNLLVSETTQMGGVRTVRCTKAYALAEAEAVDLTGAIMVKPDKPILTPNRLKRLVVKLSTEDGSPFSVELVSEGHQRVVEQTESSVTVEISTELTPTDIDDLEPYQAASTFINSADERIVAAAQEAVGDETDPWRKAQALRRAVHDLVEEKDYEVAMATASEVIETRKGDCSEHAVLLAAMARAEGLPSRVAIGFVYVFGKFCCHMWTQVYIDGAWRDVDAVLPGRDFTATHIRLTTSPMAEGDSVLDIAAFAAVFGNLKIEIVDKEYVGHDGTE